MERRFVLVDARRVVRAPHQTIWLLKAPRVLNPVIAIAMLRRARPDLCEINAMYLDCAPLRGYADLTAQVTLLAVMPASFTFDSLPTPLQNAE